MDESSEYITRAACCCSVGKAWGKYCELCPTPDEPEYAKICPSGPGYKPNEVTVRDAIIVVYLILTVKLVV